ncbi:MAG: nuclear transport factor 2 family protein [Desulfobacteraceae bacterium]|nr:nuclear transport factor 2 family protein [Desulfobacteraceae bacterium]MCB9494337.1 nuclear transport factor 2 family protein [Desulfobacteraceae bacterium]
MDRETIKTIVLKYLELFNKSDFESMTQILEPDISFENLTQDTSIVKTNGIKEFLEICRSSARIFESKQKSMITIAVENNTATAEIFFDGILAEDISKDILKGDEIRIEGYSEFEISENGLISSIKDFSR